MSTSSSSSSFYIVLPSNTNVEGNRTNTFRVRLPRKLQFNSEWYVGLAVLVYPHSWPSLGTTDDQYVTVVWRTGEQIRLLVPSASLKNPQQLRDTLHKALSEGSEVLAQNVRTVQYDYGKMASGIREAARAEHKRQTEEFERKKFSLQREKQAAAVPDILAAADIQGAEQITAEREKRAQEIAQKSIDGGGGDDGMVKKIESPVESEETIYLRMLNEAIANLDDDTRRILDETKETGLEAWVHAYRQARFACRFNFDPDTNRFSVYLDKQFIKQVELTEQLAYILGFDKHTLGVGTTYARFMPDMRGGVSSFHVYAPGLIEPMMIGDVCAPVLRIVTIRGEQDEVVEEQFLSIQYHRLLVKEISDIQIEIRTNSGALMPFQYGTCTLTLHFKKAAYF